MRRFLSFLLFRSLVCFSVFESFLSDSGKEGNPGDSTEAQSLYHGAEGTMKAGFGLPQGFPDILRSSCCPAKSAGLRSGPAPGKGTCG